MKNITCKIISLILSLSILAVPLISCAKDNSGDKPNVPETTAETVETSDAVEEKYVDGLGEYDFGGSDFTFASWRFDSCRNEFAFEEETGDLINDSIYKRNRIVEDRFNVNIKEIEYRDNDGTVRKSILSGTTSFDVANVRCPEAFTFWCDGLLIPTEEVPHLDFSKPYWSQSINESITVNNVQYVAVGALDISTYEQTFALLFNKKLIEDYALESPYDLVKSGKWTFDKMDEMMKQVLNNVDDAGKLTADGVYGYMGHTKHVMPGYWIGAGEMIIKKDQDDMPYLAMGNERFLTVFTKIFEITWDNNAWFRNMNQVSNVPAENMQKFTSDQSLFMDTSFHFIQDFRNMETDFGIIPYPKFDDAQKNYTTRMSYYYPLIIPATCVGDDLEKAGVMLEALNCESAKTVIPIYYDTVLKTKYSRDNESIEMIDLIFDVRVCDLSDSTFCDLIRDGFIKGMFETNNRNIVSKLQSTENIINSKLRRIPGADS